MHHKRRQQNRLVSSNLVLLVLNRNIQNPALNDNQHIYIDIPFHMHKIRGVKLTAEKIAKAVFQVNTHKFGNAFIHINHSLKVNIVHIFYYIIH